MTQAINLEAKSLQTGKTSWRDGLMFALVVGILPNLIFMIATPWFLAERLISPLLYLLAALVALFMPRYVAWTAFAVAAALDLAGIIMFAFHLPVNVAFDSIKYMMSIDIGASLFYIVLVSAIFAGTSVTAWLVLKNRDKFRAASPVPAAVVVFALSWADWTYNVPYFMKPDIAFDSAVRQTGLSAPAIINADKNLLVVMVEGLGAFADNRARKLFEKELLQDIPENKYTFETGVTFYHGSTTGAASRELCGQWGDYLTYIGAGEQNCLPRQLSDKGYETIAYHGFSHSMFARDQWYPEIGFTQLNFMDDMIASNGPDLPGRCGSVFAGLCDDEVANLVHQELLEKTGRKKFVYWLTLNSHIPYVAKTNGPLDCHSASAAINNTTVCELSELWLDVFARVRDMAADPSLPPTDILVVGDHHTPLWERAAKNMFLLNRVDWYLLRDQRQASRAAALKS